jgi:hypothetical protein
MGFMPGCKEILAHRESTHTTMLKDRLGAARVRVEVLTRPLQEGLSVLAFRVYTQLKGTLIHRRLSSL